MFVTYTGLRDSQMLEAQSAVTCRNIRSVHITLVTYGYITPTHFLIQWLWLSAWDTSSLIFNLYSFKNLTQKPHQIAALSNFDCRFSPRY